MFRRRTIRDPGTGLFQTPVCTVRPRHDTSLGIPMLTDSRVAIASHLPICQSLVRRREPHGVVGEPPRGLAVSRRPNPAWPIGDLPAPLLTPESGEATAAAH